MNLKKKSILLSIILVIFIQILLFINNKQKSSFRYFIWNIQEISINKLISISFVSGLIIGSLIMKSSIINILDSNKEDNKFNESKNSKNNDELNDSFEIPPQRDLRETQPTISVNYRVIKKNNENELEEKRQNLKNPEYSDDWNNIDTEW